MISVLSGQDAVITVDLVGVDGEPFVPDSGAVSWSLRGHTGTTVVSTTNITGVTNTQVSILIAGSNNQLSGRLMEKRTLEVRGLKGTRPFLIQMSYRITTFLNMTASPRDVRKYLSLDSGALPDDEIDLVEAYFDVADLITSNSLVTALSGDQTVERAANRAIVAQCVLNLGPALSFRMTKAETDGQTKIERFEMDIKTVMDAARTDRDKALALATGSAIQSTARTLIVFTDRTDPLTGA
jgi:hypothetical protein